MAPWANSDKKIKILHIDDDPSLLHFAKTFLEKENPRFDVHSFLKFDELLKNVKDPFDCLVSDYKMPDYDGLQVCKIVKEIQNKPVILYTAHGSEEIAEKAYEIGVDDYIRKEIHPSHYKVLSKRILHAVEKFRAEEKEKEYRERLEALHNYAIEIARTESIEEVVKKSFDAISKILAFNYASFHIVKDGYLVEIGSMGAELAEDFKARLDGRGITVRAVNQKTTQLVPDTTVDPDYTAWMQDLTLLSELAVPFIVNEEVLGVLNVESEDLNAFSMEDVNILETLVTHISSVSSRISSMKIIREEGEKWRNLLESSNEAAFVIVGSEIVYANKAASKMLAYEDASELIGMNSLDTVEKRYRTFIEERLHARQSGLEQPTQYEITLIGKDGRMIPVETNVALIEYNGRPASLSFCRDLTKRKAAEEKFAKLHESTHLLSLAENNQDVYRIVLDTLFEVGGYEFAGIALAQDGCLKYEKTLGVEIDDEWLVPFDAVCITARTYRTQTTQLVPDISLDPDYLYIPSVNDEGHNTQSELAVPIIDYGNAIGVINVESKEKNAFSEYDVKLVETLALHIASTIRRINSKTNPEKMVKEKTRELLEAERFISLGKISSMVAHDLRNP